MLHSYKSYTLITESKSRDKKIKKAVDKINKFLTYKPLIDWNVDRVVDRDSSKGTQYLVWFADKLKDKFVEYLNEHFGDGLDYVKQIYGKDTTKLFKDYLETGKIVGPPKLLKKQVYIKSKIKKMCDRFTSGSDASTYTGQILDWLKSPIREEEIVNLSDYTFMEANDRAAEWHDNIKATGVIIHEDGNVLLTFEDGYYWIDLETTESEAEAEAMGHCGRTSYGDTLFSLRRKQSPHVTAAISWRDYHGTQDADGTIHQMKGRENKKPVEKYFPYIMELLSYPNVSDNVKVVNKYPQITNFSTNEYLSSEDFHITDLSLEDIEKLEKRNPELVRNSGFGLKIKLYQKGAITGEELIKDVDDLEIIDNRIYLVIAR